MNHPKLSCEVEYRTEKISQRDPRKEISFLEAGEGFRQRVHQTHALSLRFNPTIRNESTQGPSDEIPTEHGSEGESTIDERMKLW